MTRSVGPMRHRFARTTGAWGMIRMRGSGRYAASSAASGENSVAAPWSVNLAVLVGLLFATWMNWSWPWGVLFVYWAIPAIRSGEAHLVGPVPRDEQPVLYWAITVLWIFLGAMTVMADLVPGALDGRYVRLWGL